MQSTFKGSLVTALLVITGPALGWDSAARNPTHPTHSYLTEYAIDALSDDYPELGRYREALIAGANTEMHELPVSGTEYGFDLETLRRRHAGTNAGTDDIEGWWDEAQTEFEDGKAEQGFFLIGVMLHMIEDMGVPAHANGVYHQGNLTKFDNFEAMALLKWAPDFSRVNRSDPRYDEPWRYYRFSQDWAHRDAPDYDDPDEFSKTWLTADDEERQLLSDRQARTAVTVQWALASAARVLDL